MRRYYEREVIYIMSTNKKKYGLLHFLFDVFMVGITGGLWLLWILFKFLRKNS